MLMVHRILKASSNFRTLASSGSAAAPAYSKVSCCGNATGMSAGMQQYDLL